MGRRLDPEERERRQKARSRAGWDNIRSGAAYAHYNPADGGFGSREQWRHAANGEGWTSFESDDLPPRVEKDFEVLGLATLPKTLGELRFAYRKMARTAHPDVGGSHAAFIALQQAFDRLARRVS